MKSTLVKLWNVEDTQETKTWTQVSKALAKDCQIEGVCIKYLFISFHLSIVEYICPLNH